MLAEAARLRWAGCRLASSSPSPFAAASAAAIATACVRACVYVCGVSVLYGCVCVCEHACTLVGKRDLLHQVWLSGEHLRGVHAGTRSLRAWRKDLRCAKQRVRVLQVLGSKLGRWRSTESLRASTRRKSCAVSMCPHLHQRLLTLYVNYTETPPPHSRRITPALGFVNPYRP